MKSVSFFRTRCTGIAFSTEAKSTVFDAMDAVKEFIADNEAKYVTTDDVDRDSGCAQSSTEPDPVVSTSLKRTQSTDGTTDTFKAKKHRWKEAPVVVRKDEACDDWTPKNVTLSKLAFRSIQSMERLEHRIETTDGCEKTFYALYIDSVTVQLEQSIPNSSQRSTTVRSAFCRIHEAVDAHTTDVSGGEPPVARLENLCANLNSNTRYGFYMNKKGLELVKAKCAHFLEKKYSLREE